MEKSTKRKAIAAAFVGVAVLVCLCLAFSCSTTSAKKEKREATGTSASQTLESSANVQEKLPGQEIPSDVGVADDDAAAYSGSGDGYAGGYGYGGGSNSDSGSDNGGSNSGSNGTNGGNGDGDSKRPHIPIIKPGVGETQAPYIELTEDYVGKTLVNGGRYIVTEHTSINAANAGTFGFEARNNVIYIPRGVTLRVYGANGYWQNPGQPAILLSSGNSLCITGEGRLECYGGCAGSGSRGQDGSNASHSDSADTFSSGKGGDGGDGGGGAGAGIGTAGTSGSDGGAGGAAVTVRMDRFGDCQRHGYAGSSSSSPCLSAEPGKLYIAGTVTVELYGGSSGDGGFGGKAGAKDVANKVYKFNGGGGAGGGGSGGTVWKAHTPFTDDDELAPMGRSGAGGRGGVGDKKYLKSIGGEGSWGSESSPHSVDGYSAGASGNSYLPPVRNSAFFYFDVLKSNHNAGRITSYLWGMSGEQSLLHLHDDESGFADAVNNGSWYVSNYLDYNGGNCNASTEFEFHTIIGSSTAPAIEAVFANEDTHPTREGFEFLGYALKSDASESELIYNARTDTLNASLLVSEGLLETTDLSDSGNTWQGWTGERFFAIWAGVESYSICYNAHGGTLVDAVSGQALESQSYVDASYPYSTRTPLWDNETVGACRLLPPESSGDAGYTLTGWQVGDKSGNVFGKKYALGEEVRGLADPNGMVYLYAIWTKIDS